MAQKQPAEINDNDKAALAQIEFGGLQARLAPLRTKLAVLAVANQQQAELASRVLGDDIPNIEAKIWQWWGEDRQKAGELYDSLRAKEHAWSDPLDRIKKNLKAILAAWQYAEKQRREMEARKQQIVVDKKMPDLGIVVQADKVEVAGAGLVVRKKGQLVEGQKIRLIQLIAAGKAPLELVTINEPQLNVEARSRWDSAAKIVTKGKKGAPDKVQRFLYERTVELYEDAGTARR